MVARPVPPYGTLPDHDALLGGRYLLQALIGTGGTADVFRGVDQVLRREVAVKVFRAGTDTVTADRFCAEARTLAGLSHRALVTVHDAGRHGQGAFMVTELIRGVTLRARIDAGPLGPVQVVRLGAEISSALDHVHAHGVIHHDVKPSNVLLREDGSPHLADFGLSRTVDDRSHPDTLVGTLAYMAPEQFLGQGASTASDVYALGVTLLESLTGRRASQETPVEAGTAHLLRPPRIPDGLPDGLGRLLTAMTEHDPRARPDAAAVHLRLRDLAQPPQPRAAASAAPRDATTHRQPSVAPRVGMPSAGAGRRSTPPTVGRAPTRRRAAAMGLAAVGAAGACVLLLGGLPAGQDAAPDASLGPRSSAPEQAEAAGPRGTEPTPPPPAPSSSSSGIPQPPASAPSAAPEPAASTGAAAPDSRRRGDHPAKAPGQSKAKEQPGKGKGKKNK